MNSALRVCYNTNIVLWVDLSVDLLVQFDATVWTDLILSSLTFLRSFFFTSFVV